MPPPSDLRAAPPAPAAAPVDPAPVVSAPVVRATSGGRRERWPALVAVGLALAAGLPQALQDLRGDDWDYVAWVGRTAPGAFLADPPPFPYLRPLNALVWEVGVRAGGVGVWAVEAPLLVLWGALLAALYGIVARAAGARAGLVAVLVALLTPELRGLPNWRSWLTTTGGLAGVLVALWIAGAGERSAPGGSRAPLPRSRVALALLAAAVGGGFKEVAWAYAALGFGAIGRLGLAAAAAVGFVVQGVLLAPPHPPGEVGAGHVPANLGPLAGAAWGWGWPLALLLVAAFAPRDSWRRPTTPLLAAAAVATAPALAFYRWNPYYTLEAATFAILALVPIAADAVRASRVARGVGAGLLLAVLLRPHAWDDYGENVPWQQRRQRDGRALLDEVLAQAAGSAPRAVWAPGDDVGPCGLARDLLVHAGAERLAERPEVGPGAGREVRECLVTLP